GRGRPAQGHAEPERRRHRRQAHQHLPLRHLSAHPQGSSPGRRGACQGSPRVNAPLIGKNGLSRRAMVFSVLSPSGALVIGVPMAARAALQPPLMADGTNPAKEMTAFLVIEPNNTVTIRVPHQEMGQGTTTGLAMLLAEELECDWAHVKVEYASANRNSRAGGNLYGRMQTVGSSGLRTSVTIMQQAGASARERLRMAAANVWKIDPADCTLSAGKCLHKASNRSLDYGALAAAAAAVQLPAEPAVNKPAN